MPARGRGPECQEGQPPVGIICGAGHAYEFASFRDIRFRRWSRVGRSRYAISGFSPHARDTQGADTLTLSSFPKIMSVLLSYLGTSNEECPRREEPKS